MNRSVAKNIRVHDLAKELGMTNAEAVDLCVVLGIPVIILTLGIGLFLINMFMLWLTAVVVPGFDASGFWQIAKAAIVIWLTNMLLSGLRPDDDRRGRVTAVWVRQG